MLIGFKLSALNLKLWLPLLVLSTNKYCDV